MEGGGWGWRRWVGMETDLVEDEKLQPSNFNSF